MFSEFILALLMWIVGHSKTMRFEKYFREVAKFLQ